MRRDEMEYVVKTYGQDLKKVFDLNNDLIITKSLGAFFFPSAEDLAERVDYNRTSFSEYGDIDITFFQDYSFNKKKKTYLTDFNVFKFNGIPFVKIVVPFTRDKSYAFVLTKKENVEKLYWGMIEKQEKTDVAKDRSLPLIGVDFDMIKANTIDFLLNKELRDFCISKDIPLKRGVIFSGLQGNGKTSTIKALKNLARKHDIDFEVFETFKQFTDIYSEWSGEKDTLKIAVFEDFDSFLTDRDKQGGIAGGELGYILNKMDGVKEITNIVNIFTTNKVETFDKAFLRPGRIDKIINFGTPQKEDIKKFLEVYLDEEIVDNVNIFNALYNHLTSREITYAEIKGIVDDIHIHKFNEIEITPEKVIEIADVQLKSASKNQDRKSDDEYVL